jgi:hypothetical protein
MESNNPDRRPMGRRLSVALAEPVEQALARMAVREERNMPDQAHVLIADGLRAAGYLEPQPPPEPVPAR